MTAEPPPGQNPYGSAPPPPPPGAYPPPGGYGAPQGAPLPPGVPAPLAEWWERLVARIIDSVIFGVVYLILSIALGVASGSFLTGFIASLIAYGAYAAYDYVLHSKDGQTIGKKIMKIQLVALGGGPLDSSVVMRRSAVYPGVFVLYGIPLVGLLASLFALATGVFILVDKPLQQGLHDKVAGTVVVKAPR
ncbi:RDD family protein [Microtetraspora glauca]|uniref:RDD family protein n=1 Tax=Microtetraspora glauca TaxID=1996 RepID=A0ABV3GSW9_MICGL